MVFNSQEFLVFFPVVVFIYFIIPKKARYIWLLVSSYYFYMSWNTEYALLIAFSTTATYLSGVLIGKFSAEGRKKGAKWSVALCLIANLGILAVFKYGNFFLTYLGKITSFLGMGGIDYRLDLLLPVGISFYTFQALSYTLDVYRRRIKPEKNILKYALFVSFFPQLVAGPIERSENLLPQIQNIPNIKVWDFERIRDGFFLMMWGLFQKLVIADRASILVDNVIHNYPYYGFVEIAAAILLFAVQIYCDFGGYTNIARGAAKVLGFQLMNNFAQPYLARNIKDFWRRWHISLTSWFTDYLYIPLGGNRKGNFRKYLNTLIVFAVSGLWHGASWNFVAWGLIHAVYQIIGGIRSNWLKKKGIRPACPDSFSVKLRNIAGTFLLVNFAWIFFVCGSVGHAFQVIRQMCSRYYVCGITNLGLNETNLWILGISIVLLAAVDLMHEKEIGIFAAFSRQQIWFRWIVCLGLIWSIIMFGIYGEAYDTSTFIYFQF